MTAATMGGHQSSHMQTDVWLTPPHILAALGPFDLDPCAAPEPRPWPTAERHIALPDDGLAADWDTWRTQSGQICLCRCHYFSAQNASRPSLLTSNISRPG